MNFQESAQIYGNDNRNDKNYDIKQCKYMYSLRIQDYFECFNCLSFCLRNYFSKKTLFRNAIRAPNSLDPDHFGGPDLGSNVCKAEDIVTELNVSISINAINCYLLRGFEADCLFL